MTSLPMPMPIPEIPSDRDAQAARSVSIVIPTVGRRPLAGLITELADDPAVLETIVVDDRRPGSAPLPTPGPATTVLHSGGRGPGAARQLGAEHCTGEILLMLDDDVRAPPALATGHARRHAGTPGLVIVGQMPLTAPLPLSPAQELYRDDYARWSVRARVQPGYALTRLWGGHFSLRRVDALAVGLHSPAFDGYRHEDLDLGLRLAAAGLRGVFTPTLSVEHHYERSVDRFLEDCWWQGAEWARLRTLHPEAELADARERYTSGLPRGFAGVPMVMANPAAIALSRRWLAAIRHSPSVQSTPLARRVLQLSRRVEQLSGAYATQDTRRIAQARMSIRLTLNEWVRA